MAQLTTPKGLGYRLPAEWEPQEAVWFAWPPRENLWPGRLAQVKERLAQLYRLAAKYQTVRVLCAASRQEQLRHLLGTAEGADRIELYDYLTDDIWIRDFGPLFLIAEDEDELCVADWRYNAWGNKFPEQERDDRTAAWISDQLGMRRFIFDSVLEGGAIESNGAGQLMTTEAVLLHANRNGETTLDSMQQKLCSGLGADSVLWFKDGICGDDTDGHIDNLARFFKSDGVLIADTKDNNNPNFQALQVNMARLQSFRTPDGRPFASARMPLPYILNDDGELLAASYLNYLVLNGAVVVPTYGQPESDRNALEIMSDCFPGREVVGFDCSDFIYEGGALHCMSQNQPKLLKQY